VTQLWPEAIWVLKVPRGITLKHAVAYLAYTIIMRTTLVNVVRRMDKLDELDFEVRHRAVVRH